MYQPLLNGIILLPVWTKERDEGWRIYREVS